MPKLVVCDTIEKQSKGVMGHRVFPKDTVYLFPEIDQGAMFHMATVPFALDIAFLDQNDKVLMVTTMPAEYGVAKAPKGTVKALEGPVGFFDEYRDSVPLKEFDYDQ